MVESATKVNETHAKPPDAIRLNFVIRLFDPRCLVAVEVANPVNHNVLRFDIAMKHSAYMAVCEGAGQLADDGAGHWFRYDFGVFARSDKLHMPVEKVGPAVRGDEEYARGCRKHIVHRKNSRWIVSRAQISVVMRGVATRGKQRKSANLHIDEL